MKSTAIVCAIAAASLGFSSLSFAQGHDRRGDGNGQRFEQRDRQDDRGRRDFNQYNNGQRHFNQHFNQRQNGPRGFDQRTVRNNTYQYGARGPQFYRGGHIPQQYRAQQYVVNDWRGHRLSAPPRGHQYVQVGTDYALIAIATGLIAHLVLNQ